jgi:hypothetical protein
LPIEVSFLIANPRGTLAVNHGARYSSVRTHAPLT